MTNQNEFVKQTQNGATLLVKVQPRAARTELCGLYGNALKIKVAAPPVEDKANAALVEFIAELLQCPRSAVTITHGHKSHLKTVAILGVTPAQVRAALDAAMKSR